MAATKAKVVAKSKAVAKSVASTNAMSKVVANITAVAKRKVAADAENMGKAERRKANFMAHPGIRGAFCLHFATRRLKPVAGTSFDGKCAASFED
jgi:hypothetical protein